MGKKKKVHYIPNGINTFRGSGLPKHRATAKCGLHYEWEGILSCNKRLTEDPTKVTCEVCKRKLGIGRDDVDHEKLNWAHEIVACAEASSEYDGKTFSYCVFCGEDDMDDYKVDHNWDCIVYEAEAYIKWVEETA